MAKWIKTTPYGDYKETKDRKNSRTNRNVHIIREAKSIMVAGKHAGSKPISRLLNGIAKAHEAKKDIKKEPKKEESKEEVNNE